MQASSLRAMSSTLHLIVARSRARTWLAASHLMRCRRAMGLACTRSCSSCMCASRSLQALMGLFLLRSVCDPCFPAPDRPAKPVLFPTSLAVLKPALLPAGCMLAPAANALAGRLLSCRPCLLACASCLAWFCGSHEVANQGGLGATVLAVSGIPSCCMPALSIPATKQSSVTVESFSDAWYREIHMPQ